MSNVVDWRAEIEEMPDRTLRHMLLFVEGVPCTIERDNGKEGMPFCRITLRDYNIQVMAESFVAACTSIIVLYESRRGES